MKASIIKAFIPIIYLLLGTYIGSNFFSKKTPFFLPQNKTQELQSFIFNEYVDSINIDSITELTIEKMLKSLDPHSTYIPLKEINAVSENMQGSFEGIGVEFEIQKDTIVVVAPIIGGPSEKIGIKSGDRIVVVEEDTIANKRINNNKVIRLLRGKKGTKVNVFIKRRGVSKWIPFSIIRDKIPLYSVDAAYHITPSTFYIKINRFSETTFSEFKNKTDNLNSQSIKNVILDLRGNPGGYLHSCVQVIDEFLKKGTPIVYTKGKNRDKKEYFSTKKGVFQESNIIVLIDEGSASASEIIAGAIQDNDRGTIIGRRSFGKGLVQEQWFFDDGSALRLTTAKYYTPTGRSIQRPYKDSETYYNEHIDRFKTGEVYFKDSINIVDTIQFKTPKGKIVYGGGGIIPDVYVPYDTTIFTSQFYHLINTGLISDFSCYYADKNRADIRSNNIPNTCFSEFLNFLLIDKREEVVFFNEKEKLYLKAYVEASVARNINGRESFYPIIHRKDPYLIEALKQINKN